MVITGCTFGKYKLPPENRLEILMDKNKEKKLKKLGSIINELRLEKRISLRRLALDLGMTHVAISNIEKGKADPHKDTLLKIARALDYDIDKMLAKASKLDDDIENLIYEKSDTVPLFLRTAKNLTQKQWKEITEKVKNMSDKNNEK